MRAGMEKQRMRSAKSPPPPPPRRRGGRVLTVVSTRFLTRERSKEERRRERNWFARSRRRHDRGHRTRWRGEEGPCRRLPWERGKASCPRRTHRPARGRTEREACARARAGARQRERQRQVGPRPQGTRSGPVLTTETTTGASLTRDSHTSRARAASANRAFFLPSFFFVSFFFFFPFVLSLSLSLSLAFLFSSFFTRLAWPLFLGHTRPRRACSPSRISLSASLLLLLLLLRSSGGMIDATSCGTPRLRPGINCYRETALWGAFEFFSRVLILLSFGFFFLSLKEFG